MSASSAKFALPGLVDSSYGRSKPFPQRARVYQIRECNRAERLRSRRWSEAREDSPPFATSRAGWGILRFLECGGLTPLFPPLAKPTPYNHHVEIPIDPSAALPPLYPVARASTTSSRRTLTRISTGDPQSLQTILYHLSFVLRHLNAPLYAARSCFVVAQHAALFALVAAGLQTRSFDFFDPVAAAWRLSRPRREGGRRCLCRFRSPSLSFAM